MHLNLIHDHNVNRINNPISGDNDGWSTPNFTKKPHRARKTLQLQFVDGGQACSALELDTFMQWFHVHDCSLDVVTGADLCCPGAIASATVATSTADSERGLRRLASGRAAEVNVHKQHLLG